MTDLYKTIQTHVDDMEEGDGADMIAKLMNTMMTKDKDIEKTFADVSKALRNNDDEVAIIARIGSNNSSYEILVAITGVIEFIYYLARKALTNNVITSIECLSLYNTLYEIGLPSLGLFKHPFQFGGDKLIKEYQKKEKARKDAINILVDAPNGKNIIEILELDKEFPSGDDMPTPTTSEIMGIYDEYTRFLNMSEDGKIHIVEILMDVAKKYELFPRLNTGVVVTDIVSRKERETHDEWIKRYSDLCRDVAISLTKIIENKKIKTTLEVYPVHFGEVVVEGILPERTLELLDKRAEVKALFGAIENVNISSPNE